MDAVIPFETQDLARLEALADLSAVSPEVALRRPLADLVLATLKAAARSEHTARAYRTAIGLFVQYLDQERGGQLPELADWRPFAVTSKDGRRTAWEYRPPCAVLRLVDAGILDGFRFWREAEGDGPNAVTTRIYAVRAFLRVALRDGVLTPEQGNAMGLQPYRQRQRRDEKPVGRRLSPVEVRALRDTPDLDAVKGRRDLAILDCMLFLGLRRQEVADLRLENFRQDNGRWWLVLSGKGKKTRRLKVHDTLYNSLEDWLASIERELGDGEGPIFVGVNKGDWATFRQINASVVGRLVAEYGHKAGLAPRHGGNRLSAHDLRRTAARNAYDNGASLLLVQALLGHADPKTTTAYIGAFEDDSDTATDHIRY